MGFLAVLSSLSGFFLFFIFFFSFYTGLHATESYLDSKNLWVNDGDFNYSFPHATLPSLGYVGIGVSSSNHVLQVSGNARVHGVMGTQLISATTFVDLALSNRFTRSVSSTPTFTLGWTIAGTFPPYPMTFSIAIVHTADGVTSANWPSSVKWPIGEAPILSGTNGSTDIIYFYYADGAYYGVAVFDY